MNAEQKNTALRFLDLAACYLYDGLKREREGTFNEEPETTPAPIDTAPVDNAPISSPQPSASNTAPDSLEAIAAEIRACKKCRLCEQRKNAAPGEGVLQPQVLVIGEGPGADEDAAGRPFVGRAGQLLDKMLASINLSRETNCFIANVVKCRPPENRDPQNDEMDACIPFLLRQIAILKPRVILCVGRISSQKLLNTETGITKLRGKFHQFSFDSSIPPVSPIPLLPTYHPSALLRNEELKRPAWEDLKVLRSKLAGIDDKD
ncbi:uracil-DNA glycosylase [Spirochaetia bacterium]|nr:uracil-DNA glycosylase [Spirochaetia bacterium]